MNIYVWTLDNGYFTKKKVIDYSNSVIWVSRYCDCGEFEIYIPASKELMELFKGDVLFTRDDSDTTMMLEKIKLTTDIESGDFLIVSGRSLESVLSRRVINRQTTLDGTLAEGVSQLIEQSVINPTTLSGNSDTERIISNIEIADISGFTDILKKQITGDNLLTSIIEICTAYGCGFKLNNNKDIDTFVFSIYKGRDISGDVIFSPKLGNISKTEYTIDYSQSPNAVYVAGEGEGIERVVMFYEPTLNTEISDYSEIEGLNRKEYWYDQRDCSSTSGTPMTDTFYLELLRSRGKEKFNELRPVAQYSGELLDNGMYKYKADYNLGDTVLIENDYGVRAKATIVEITEVEDVNGYTIVPKLSEWRVLNG